MVCTTLGLATPWTARPGDPSLDPAAAAATCSDPSGQCLPATPTGYHAVCLDDFTVGAPTGSWGTKSGSAVVYTGDQGCQWTEYPDGWPSTYTKNKPGYQPAQVLSVHDGVLDFYLHNVNGLPSGANPSPVLSSGSQYQTYGMYSVRAQVVYGDRFKLDDYHIAWLLWPQNDNNWQSAESDFPEANLNDSQVCAYAHYGGRGAQDSYCTPVDFTQWHTYTQVWGPGYRSYYVDGTLIGTSTNKVWTSPERWQIQTEPSGHNDGDSGHVLIDWVAVYAPGTGPSVPSVSGINPNSGASSGGTTVTVTGTNFASGDTVKFGSTAATGVSVTSATSLKATSPAGTGTVDVTVAGPGGTSATNSADQFTYTGASPPAPTVSGLSPTSGPSSGGTTVTITGSNFANGDTVKFGALSASKVTVTSPTSLTAVSPAVGGGSIRLVQSTSGGSGSGTTRSLGLPSAVTAGDGLVLLFSNTIDSAATVTSVTGGGVTWQRADQENDNTVTADLEIWYGLASTGGSSKTITLGLSASTSGSYSIDVTEWSGLAGLDQHPAGTVNHSGSAAATAPSITPSATGDLFIAAVGANAATKGSPGGGFSALASGSGTGFGYLVAADGAAHQYSQALSSSASWDGVAVSFLAATTAPTTVDVTVTGPGGTSTIGSADQYTYEP